MTTPENLDTTTATSTFPLTRFGLNHWPLIAESFLDRAERHCAHSCRGQQVDPSAGVRRTSPLPVDAANGALPGDVREQAMFDEWIASGSLLRWVADLNPAQPRMPRYPRGEVVAACGFREPAGNPPERPLSTAVRERMTATLRRFSEAVRPDTGRTTSTSPSSACENCWTNCS